MAVVSYDLHLMMEKRFFFVAVALMLCLCPAVAQNSLNDNADNIVGTYAGQQGSDRFRANMTAEFTADGQLRIRGTLLGIGETIYWQKL
ncbi:MAG: hypothetical protein J6T56_08900 [Bacteroidales bacterium]|nr:hypothetical protein [Bacteroidales bacterium]